MTEDEKAPEDQDQQSAPSKEAKESASVASEESSKADAVASDSVVSTENDEEGGADSKKLTSEEDIDDFLSVDEEGGEKVDTSSVDAALSDMAPDFQDELDQISKDKFAGVIINKGSASEEDIDVNKKSPSLIKAYIQNIPAKKKKIYMQALGVLFIGGILALLIFRGFILPQFQFPYMVSMKEMSNKITTYPTDADPVPLFDDFRNKTFTFALPKTTINLKVAGDDPAYGEFEFFLNLRDKDLLKVVQKQEGQIIEVVRDALDDVTWRELETPVGKQRVKKLLRQRINEHLDGNMVLSVYYRSVLLSR